LVSDADSGEDKMEKGAKKLGLSVFNIAKKFEAQFKDSCLLLNITLPKDLMHATDYIKEQIELVQKLQEKGFTYKTTDGIYFDTSKFPDYFKLSRQNPLELKAGTRVDIKEKKNVSDFALWKFSSIDEKRQMEWESPFGVGFPGWHIECSAMSMKALGETFDIHTGGIDHIDIHHTNEIAQSQAATGKTFVNYWVHHNFLVVEGQKMSKSLENFYTVEDVVAKGFDPMALRYLYLQTHYRQEMNFTWDALEAAQTALNKLRRHYLQSSSSNDSNLSAEFIDAINDDLNMSKAMSFVWENINDLSKSSLDKIDDILGLNLSLFQETKVFVPAEIQELTNKREKLRKSGNYKEADKVRQEIEEKGFMLNDTSSETVVVKKN
jgi:cysteinyl-tRNA synthetase